MKKSDFTIDKNITTVANVPIVREAVRDFCACFTDGDIRRVACDLAEKYGVFINPTADVLRIRGEAFCGLSYADRNDVHIRLDLFLLSPCEAWDVSFFCDSNLTPNGDILNVRHYEKADDFNTI